MTTAPRAGYLPGRCRWHPPGRMAIPPSPAETILWDWSVRVVRKALALVHFKWQKGAVHPCWVGPPGKGLEVNLGLQGNQGDPTWWVSGCLSKDADPEMLTGFRGSMWTSQVFDSTIMPCLLTARSPVSSSGPPGRPSWASLLACPAPGVSSLVPSSHLPHSPDSSPSSLLSQTVLCDKAETPSPWTHPPWNSFQVWLHVEELRAFSYKEHNLCKWANRAVFSGILVWGLWTHPGVKGMTPDKEPEGLLCSWFCFSSSEPEQVTTLLQTPSPCVKWLSGRSTDTLLDAVYFTVFSTSG